MISCKIKFVLALFVFILSWDIKHAFAADQLEVVYPKEQSHHDPRAKFFIDLLNLALENTRQTHGEYQVKLSDNTLPPTRVPVLVRQEQIINIMSSPVTNDLNESMRAIPFPLLMGIQGIRVSFVHQDKQTLFKLVKEFKDLRKIIFAQGVGWLDTLILKEAKLKVDTSNQYESLFAMLVNNRIDALPRGANEIFPELDKFKADYTKMTVDPYMAFYYHLPVYFYVSNNNQALADRILLGLELAKKNGHFKRLFEQYFAKSLAQLNLSSRKVFILKNTHLPQITEGQIEAHLHPFIKQILFTQSQNNLE